MKAVLLILSAALAGCATVPPAETGPTASINQLANSNGLRVRPIALVEDSRCPINAVCVWAGRLVVRAEVSGGNWRQTRDFELRKPQPIADGQLTLVEAAPGKMAGEATKANAYRFTFAFAGGL